MASNYQIELVKVDGLTRWRVTHTVTGQVSYFPYKSDAKKFVAAQK